MFIEILKISVFASKNTQKHMATLKSGRFLFCHHELLKIVLQVLKYERCVRVRLYKGPTPEKLHELVNTAPLPSAGPIPARRGRGGARGAPRVKRMPTEAEAAIPDSERRDLAFGKRVIAGKGTPVEILVTTLLPRCDAFNTSLLSIRLLTPTLLSTARCTRLSSLTWQCWSTFCASSDAPSRGRYHNSLCLLSVIWFFCW